MAIEIEYLTNGNIIQFKSLLTKYYSELELNWTDNALEEVLNIIITKNRKNIYNVILLKVDATYSGFIIFCDEFADIKNKSFICELFISKDYRRKGLGEYLYGIAEKEFKKNKKNGVWLTTDSAYKFWQNLGFIKTDQKAAHNNCLIFVKEF